MGSILDFTVVQQVSYDYDSMMIDGSAVKTHGHVSIMIGESIHIKRMSLKMSASPSDIGASYLC